MYKTVEVCCPTEEAESSLSATITENEGLGYRLVSYRNRNNNTVTASDSGEKPDYEYSNYYVVFAPICKN